MLDFYSICMGAGAAEHDDAQCVFAVLNLKKNLGVQTEMRRKNQPLVSWAV